ncbi:probable NADP-dependent alcohol dehydrogenase [Ramularia collo-cygni]|uniref:Probable NADP-dependent alcohol dehydrogenase n=1 Tax=Ramularia collo-cygni TaxID=112498 RepID=A0A2D3VC00_9PEZI|nr:probable NADP-dependent alcohol dehydrogenase [Ramularia collo-cygni]CZT22347.1 probable NADP-dependent alcohol dehydrogenase [Ramularia collo-cygni]
MPSFTVYKGSKDGKVIKTETTKPDLKGDQVLLRITASGLCGTDSHYRHVDQGLGHEGVGVIEQVGPAVTHLKAGDRVGFGYLHDSCGHCQECLAGRETYCPQRKLYGYADLDQGSFASHAVWRESYLFKIPDSMSDEVCAPLMCGGATVFNTLNAYNFQPTETVAIMGVGGLGHLAIQFAAKMGAHVIVLSSSDRKKDEAMRLGAHEFIATKDVEKIETSKPINRLLVTTSAQPEWQKIVPALAPGATIHPLSVDEGNFSMPYIPLLAGGLTVQGSIVASRYIQNRMLEFAALHKIEPIIEKFPMNETAINEAMDKLAAGNMRYRGVFIAE